MATTELKTRIILRNDTFAKWSAVKDTLVLMKGEVAVEFNPDASATARRRIKIGDGVSVWSALPYFGEEYEQSVYQVDVADNEDDITKLNEAAEAASATLNKGDIGIAKHTISGTLQQYTAYVYNGTTWIAMDGNYSAENVYFKEDLTYTAAIGVLPKPASSATLSAAGKNVKQVLSSILAKEEQPTITNPTAKYDSISFPSSMTVEPGYAASGSVSYDLGLVAGSYSYGPTVEGVSADGYTLVYNDGTNSDTTLTTETGTFDYEFTVGTANKTVKIVSAKVHYTDASNYAKTNMGNETTTKITAADTVNSMAKTCAFTSSRKSFWLVDNTTGTTLHPNATAAADKLADSALIRSCANNAFGTKISYALTIAQGTNRVLIAVPGKHSMTSCIDVDGMGLDVKSNFTVYENNIYVGGCDQTSESIGSYETTYTVFVCENAAGLNATTYNITLA